MQDIIEFEKNYKDSEEERQDLLKLYVQNEGDMDAITAAAMCCTQEDEPRIVNLIQSAIDKREVPVYSAFVQETEQKKKSRKKRVWEDN